MKSFASEIFLCVVFAGACTYASAAQAPRRGAPPSAPPPAPAGVYTTVSGTIAHFNYDREGEVSGFLLNNNSLVQLPPQATLRISGSLHKGDTVQIAGYTQTSPSGFQTIQAQTVQDRTSGKTFSMPQPGGAAPYSGSGRVEQLNYGSDGAINGFLLDNGTLASLPPFAATNPSSIRPGVAIAYSGYARRTLSGRTVVDLQTLNINGQTITIGVFGPGSRAAAPPAPPPSAGTSPGAAPNSPPPPPAGAPAPQPAPPAP